LTGQNVVAIRWIVRPDADGLIRITHKGEPIEIQVDYSHVAAPSPTPNMPPGPAPNPSSPEGSPLPPPIIAGGGKGKRQGNPFDRPHSYFVAPDGGAVDINGVTEELSRRFADGAESNPDSLVLNVRSLDLDAFAELGRQIGKTYPDLPIGIDFGGIDFSGNERK
jgi:hypothetical protein